jgi:hypothetical protein
VTWANHVRSLTGEAIPEKPLSRPRRTGGSVTTGWVQSSCGIGPAHKEGGERALPRPVRAHDGVNFAAADVEVEALEDLAAGDVHPPHPARPRRHQWELPGRQPDRSR